jgi:hypothetical protein
MTDVLKAINNISKLENWNIEEVVLSSNRTLSMGEGLESFVKMLLQTLSKQKIKMKKIYFFLKYFHMKVQKELLQI